MDAIEEQLAAFTAQEEAAKAVLAKVAEGRAALFEEQCRQAEEKKAEQRKAEAAAGQVPRECKHPSAVAYWRFWDDLEACLQLSRAKHHGPGPFELAEEHVQTMRDAEDIQRELKLELYDLGLLVQPPPVTFGMPENARSSGASVVYSAETAHRLHETKDKVAALKAKIRSPKAEKEEEEDRRIKREGS